MDRRVVVTGLGVVSPVGVGKERFWESIKAGKGSFGRVTRFDVAAHPCKIAAEVKDLRVEDFIKYKEIRRMDIFDHFAIAAAKLALADAKFEITDENCERVGLCIGSGIGGIYFGEQEYKVFLAEGLRKISPYTSVAIFLCGSLGFVSIEMGIKGWSTLITSCGASGTDAIGYGYEIVQEGRADVVLAAGTEAPVTSCYFNALCRVGALSTTGEDRAAEASRPFDRRRNGMVLGEGCGLLVIEELEHAVRRGAHIYAEILGYGRANGRYEIADVVIDGASAREAVEMAIGRAGLQPRDIGYINANAASELESDRIEAAMIGDVWKGLEVPVSSIKGTVGHAVGAAGGYQGIVNALAIDEGFVPPNANYEEPDPACALAAAPSVGMERPVRYAIQHSFGYTGASAALVMGKFNL